MFHKMFHKIYMFIHKMFQHFFPIINELFNWEIYLKYPCEIPPPHTHTCTFLPDSGLESKFSYFMDKKWTIFNVFPPVRILLTFISVFCFLKATVHFHFQMWKCNHKHAVEIYTYFFLEILILFFGLLNIYQLKLTCSKNFTILIFTFLIHVK